MKIIRRLFCGVLFKMVSNLIQIPQDTINGNQPYIKQMQKLRENHARNQIHDYSHVFRKKSRFDLVRLSFIIIGIEFAFAAETAFVSPILLGIGIEHQHMTMVWSLSPMLGFFLAPLLGSISDRCRSKWGRRRPVILLLFILMLMGLTLIPWGKTIGEFFGDNQQNNTTSPYEITGRTNQTDITPTSYKYKWAAIITVLGTVLLDFSADTCQTPSRTYVLDVCVNDDQAKGLSTYGILAGIGGFFGYLLGAIDWETTVLGDLLGDNIKTVFFIVMLVLIISTTITLTSFREIPLSLLEKDSLLRPITQETIQKELHRNKLLIHSTQQHKKPISQTDGIVLEEFNVKNDKTNGISVIQVDNPDGVKIIDNQNSDVNVNKLKEEISLLEYLKSIVKMPKSLRVLCLTNLFSWMAFVSYCLYFTDFVGEAVFGGDPSSESNSPEKYQLYQAGIRYGCYGLAIYAISCSVYSLVIERLIGKLGAKIMYVGGLIIYGFGMLILAIFPSKIGVLLLSTTAGVIYATIFTIPYILIARYHATGSFKVIKGESVPIKQARGLGTDIAVISSMMFVAQIIISLSIGPLISYMETTTVVIYTSSTLSLCAAIVAFKVTI